MYCANCGAELAENSDFCVNCGKKVENSNDKLSLISMILGIASVGSQVLNMGSSLCLPAAVAGLILGLIAKSRGVNDTKNKVGIICSIVGIGLHIVSTIAAIVFLVLYFAFFATVMGSAVMGY